MRLSYKLQISRFAHPFKVSCLRADYTLVNFNNESLTPYPREFRRRTVRRLGERRKQTSRALLARFEVIVRWNEINRRKAPRACYTVSN